MLKTTWVNCLCIHDKLLALEKCLPFFCFSSYECIKPSFMLRVLFWQRSQFMNAWNFSWFDTVSLTPIVVKSSHVRVIPLMRQVKKRVRRNKAIPFAQENHKSMLYLLSLNLPFSGWLTHHRFRLMVYRQFSNADRIGQSAAAQHIACDYLVEWSSSLIRLQSWTSQRWIPLWLALWDHDLWSWKKYCQLKVMGHHFQST